MGTGTPAPAPHGGSGSRPDRAWVCGGLKHRHLRSPLARPDRERPDAGGPGWAGFHCPARPLQLRPCHCPRGGTLGRSRGRAGGRGKEEGWGSGVWVARRRLLLPAPAVLDWKGTQASGPEPRRAPCSAAPAAHDYCGTLPPPGAGPPLAARPPSAPIYPLPALSSSETTEAPGRGTPYRTGTWEQGRGGG